MLRTLALLSCIATAALADEPVETREIILVCGQYGFTIHVNPVTKVARVGAHRSIARLDAHAIVVDDAVGTIRINRDTGIYSAVSRFNEPRGGGRCSESGRHKNADDTPRG
jgi:hypothetical protein